MRVALALVFGADRAPAQIPRTWSQAAIDSLELPLARPEYSPVHISEAEYYRIPERTLYRTYPVYAPGREPQGYREWLTAREPEVEFDASGLKTTAEWTAAGELVFRAPTAFRPVFFNENNMRDPEFFKHFRIPVGREGVVPFATWVVRKKGVVELGSMGCNTCHTRVLEDGSIVAGAPGNNPSDRQGAQLLRESAAVMGTEKALNSVRSFARQFELPWLAKDFNQQGRQFSLAEFIAAGDAIPPGVTARANTSLFLPPQIPDLIGVRERRYLDHTALIRHRDIGDLMRYSSLAQDLFAADRYGPFDPEKKTVSTRYSDPQLYALALYIQSLQPPANPNSADSAAARRGSTVFRREKCSSCHTPPFYTNNKLVAVDGFEPRARTDVNSDILPVRIGTDPRYALQTRKGTGYYKVPSLQGVWYRGPFGHDGAAATLEEWLEPARVTEGYVPGGFKGFDGSSRSIPGHRFGLDIKPSDRADLIAFLRSL